MAYADIITRLKAIDIHNPIRDPNDISKAAESGFHHPCSPEYDSESQWQSDDCSDMED
jgi:hypothetical protein